MNLSLVLSVIISNVAMTPLSGLVTLVGETNGQQNQSSLDKYIMHADEVRTILGYCYQHADRPNPVQDLVDKGLVSADFTGDTCASVKQGSEDAQVTLLGRAGNASIAYDECVNKYTEGENDVGIGLNEDEDFLSAAEYAECYSIVSDYCDNPVTARHMYSTCNR